MGSHIGRSVGSCRPARPSSGRRACGSRGGGRRASGLMLHTHQSPSTSPSQSLSCMSHALGRGADGARAGLQLPLEMQVLTPGRQRPTPARAGEPAAHARSGPACSRSPVEAAVAVVVDAVAVLGGGGGRPRRGRGPQSEVPSGWRCTAASRWSSGADARGAGWGAVAGADGADLAVAAPSIMPSQSLSMRSQRSITGRNCSLHAPGAHRGAGLHARAADADVERAGRARVARAGHARRAVAGDVPSTLRSQSLSMPSQVSIAGAGAGAGPQVPTVCGPPGPAQVCVPQLQRDTPAWAGSPW